MRIISGSKKGHRLKGPKGKNTRPTEDRIKESLFNILGYIDEDSIVLDLFAGSGGVGIEFLSRGAKKAYFVDKAYESIRCIKENLNHTDLKNNAKIIKSNVIKAIAGFDNRNIKFNYIFADPPYGYDLIKKTMKKMSASEILKEKGNIILEHEKDLILEDRICDFKKIDYRKYGNKSLTFYTLDKI